MLQLGMPTRIENATLDDAITIKNDSNRIGVEEKAADEQIRRLVAEIEKKPEAQYMLFFRGRSVPATYQEAYESTNADGLTYMSVAFWDGDSGNLFDVDFRLVPERVLANGVEIFAKDIK